MNVFDDDGVYKVEEDKKQNSGVVSFGWNGKYFLLYQCSFVYHPSEHCFIVNM